MIDIVLAVLFATSFACVCLMAVAGAAKDAHIKYADTVFYTVAFMGLGSTFILATLFMAMVFMA